MRKLCRVEARERDSTSELSAEIRKGKLTERANWVIRDGKRYVPTECTTEEVGKAERVLKRYLAEKHSPTRKEQHIETIVVRAWEPRG
jgi:hypothetical protein